MKDFIPTWKIPGPPTRCELWYYILPSDNQDLKFCGCPIGLCPGYKKYRYNNHNICKYYDQGKKKAAKLIAEMMPLPKGITYETFA